MRSAPSRLRTTSSRSAAKWQHRTITSSAFAGYFSPILRFEKIEIHKVFLHFSNLASTKNLSTNALAEWCGAALFIMLGIRNEKLGIGIAGSRNCHCEGASRPWQSHAPTSEFAEVALLSPRVLRDCHVGLRPPRNDTSGEHGAGNGALHRISRPIAASRTGLAVPAPTTCYRYPKFIRPQPLRNRPHRPRGARRS